MPDIIHSRYRSLASNQTYPIFDALLLAPTDQFHRMEAGGIVPTGGCVLVDAASVSEEVAVDAQRSLNRA